VKRIERDNGKVWVGFFHVWVTSKDGERLRRKKEKVLGPAAFTREEPAQTTVIHTYADLWRTFSGLKIGPVLTTLPGNNSIRFCDPRSASDWQATTG
jgi:hypothetical protein